MSGNKAIESESEENLTERQVAQCPGCKTPLEERHWGIPSKFCEGFVKSYPKRETKGSTDADGCCLDSLKAELEALDVEVQALRRKAKDAQL